MRSLIIRLFILLGLLFPALYLIATPALAVTYSDNGDGTVTDPTTGLVWMRCSMGQTWDGSTCTGTASTYAWAAATALTSTFAGKSDWRLPNVRELQTIVDRSHANPAIDTAAFPNTTTSDFWSGSPNAYSSDYAWYVDFRYGNAHDSFNYSTCFVRLVRGGQSLALLSDARPDTDYTDNGDGTVTHKPTGLMWKKCSEGQVLTGSACTGTATQYTWDQAMALTDNFSGKSDWRLPTEDELSSLADYTKYNPATNATFFPGTPSLYFWSASAHASFSGDAWYVYFYYGSASYSPKDFPFLVRLVRGGILNFVSGWNLLGNSANAPLTVAATFNDATKVSTVWKWIPATSKWAFYTPSLADGGAAYAVTKGYDFLTTITGGEGFWVNAKAGFATSLPTGTAVTTISFQDQIDPTQNKLLTGWNLIAMGDNVTPSVFNHWLSVTPPAQGVIPLNVTTLWAWDSALLNWYFYAPSLEANGTLASYITGKNYLNFSTPAVKTLDPTMGFWVNKP